MSNVPKLRFKEFSGEWEEKYLLSIGKIITGSTPSTDIKEYYNGNKLFVSPSDVNVNRFIESTKTTLTELGFSKGRKVDKYSVCFICIGSTIGKVGQLSEDSITNQQINCITANKNNSNNFIYSLLEKYAPKIKLLAGVQALPQINKTDFSKFKFKFPHKQEQEKIASFLTSIDSKIEQLTKKESLLQEYKKGVMQKIFNQEIRFKADDGSEFCEWEEKELGEIFKRVVSKNKENNKNVLTISAQQGLINQEEFFNKSVSAKDITNYYLISKNDFAYNKSYSNGYPMGAIKKLNRYEKGVVSTLYICFRILNGNYSADFYEKYFDSGLFNREIEKIAQEGARNHGLLNVSVVDFFSSTILPCPSIEEQIKIANFLSSIDKKIENTRNELEKTKEFKKALLQQMFV